MKLRSPIILLLTVLLVLQGALTGLPAFAASGTNLPNVTDYGVYSYDPGSNDDATTVAIGTTLSTGNDGRPIMPRRGPRLPMCHIFSAATPASASSLP